MSLLPDSRQRLLEDQLISHYWLRIPDAQIPSPRCALLLGRVAGGVAARGGLSASPECLTSVAGMAGSRTSSQKRTVLFRPCRSVASGAIGQSSVREAVSLREFHYSGRASLTLPPVACLCAMQV